ncbi:MAG: acetate kinase [Candidatus Omnitrophica bacterium]|nr:acetate kinase [Candidatus Omnitrophota bacterium]
MILVINSGSSSIKYKVFKKKRETLLARGTVDRIGLKGYPPDHSAAIRLILKRLTDKNRGALKDLSQIRAVGHRVVHGGERFKESVKITAGVIREIERFSRLAPLHNPPNLLGIKACRRFLPKVPQAAVFDTAFYQTLPEAHYIYAIPYGLYKRYGIRRYGFHGTSHKYVAIKTAEALNKRIADLKIITCHLGNGCSVTATANGKAVDTSMGFTPLEGLVMGTRCGDIDPAAVFYLMEKRGVGLKAAGELLNKRSGLLGISGISSDMRDIYKAVKKGDRRARLSFDIFIHRIHKYIGAFAAIMNGAGAITFTGGIGENHPPTRKRVCENLGFLGVKIDNKKNSSNAAVISKPDSGVKVLVIPTDEELMIAKETKELIVQLRH